MSADDMQKKWPVLDTTPFPESTAVGELVDKEYGEFSAVHEHGCVATPILQPYFNPDSPELQSYQPHQPHHPHHQ